MKIFIMTDLEGVAGVQDSGNWCSSEGRYYLKARELLTMELNAAVEGFLSAGAKEILVADGHGGGAVNPEQLNRRAELVRNWPPGKHGTFCLDDRKFDFFAFVGQHPMAGTVGGHLCHTGNMGVVEQTVNGLVVGEFGDLVLIASELGLRTIFATGCRAFCHEAEALVPGIETVAVKRGTQTEPGNHLPSDLYRKHNMSAIHLHPEEARARIKKGAEKAVKRAQQEKFGLVKLPRPPYRRTRVARGGSTYPPRILVQTHPESLLKMHWEPFTCHALRINPAAAELKKLVGEKIL